MSGLLRIASPAHCDPATSPLRHFSTRESRAEGRSRALRGAKKLLPKPRGKLASKSCVLAFENCKNIMLSGIGTLAKANKAQIPSVLSGWCLKLFLSYVNISTKYPISFSKSVVVYTLNSSNAATMFAMVNPLGAFLFELLGPHVP
jgi:hypothetical protein